MRKFQACNLFKRKYVLISDFLVPEPGRKKKKMPQEEHVGKVVGDEIEEAREGEGEKDMSLGINKRLGQSRTSTPVGVGKKASPTKVVRGKWIAKANRERGGKKKEKKKSPGTGRGKKVIKRASSGAHDGFIRTNKDIRGWLNKLDKETERKKEGIDKEEKGQEKHHSSSGEERINKENVVGMNESLAELKKNLNSSMNTPEFDSTTSSVIEEMLELTSRIEKNGFVG